MIKALKTSSYTCMFIGCACVGMYAQECQMSLFITLQPFVSRKDLSVNLNSVNFDRFTARKTTILILSYLLYDAGVCKCVCRHACLFTLGAGI